jgi:hypothetical protein
MGIATLGWSLLLLIYVGAVEGLFQRGFGSTEAILTFVGLPLLGLLSAVPLPLLLYRTGWNRTARAMAVLATVALIPAFAVTFTLAAI